MSRKQDKNVLPLPIDPQYLVRLGNDDARHVDIYNEISVCEWTREAGRRIEAAVARIGKDKSVYLTGRSWKQLQRYFIGHEPPIGIVKLLANAAGASSDYLIEGIVRTVNDAEIQRIIIDAEIAEVRKSINAASDHDEKFRLTQKEVGLISSAGFYLNLQISLHNKPRYGKYDDIISSSSDIPAGMVGIPLLDTAVSAGGGAVVWAENTVNFVYFNEAWLRQNYRVNPAHLAILHTAGESMEPTINASELLLVDRSATRAADGIFVVRLDENLLVKRLQCLPGGQIKVSSDNPAYEPFTVRLDDGADFAILGRVVLALGLRHL